ncbi:murein biosynthesis integral membrane protein MurJ [Luteolibacter yonseiensis]|uniref:Murein biosynthesis integral membrane protein MurJ n=1 Tax=Luteolibacter yonseiensis TaxID=1144680 RepID=A0A934V655_9BACT|nr:murein biosynthesis integral membrane protein MurJ [Luteolibacter yonseiensis]MBK1814672.1 murein biosynthesis integral membrane protein MurJ [Luteolibacter yonseiensis]
MAATPTPPAKAVRGGAVFVAAGIFLSRIAGLVRTRVFNHYFAGTPEGDVFTAAMRIPNFLQNLFGEGVLSASFIPVYARLLGEKRGVEADRVAGVIATLLAIVTSLLALAGMLLSPYLVAVIAGGFDGANRELTVQCVRIVFPGVALLVMSAWCLGVLNSHRRFFLSYVAPVIWNLSIIAAMWWFGSSQSLDQLAKTACWGLVMGSFLQLAIQLPTVLKLAPDLKFSAEWASQNVRTVLGSFSSVVVSRGVVQISAFIDSAISTRLPWGVVLQLANAQMIYMLPGSIFGMSVSATSLARMSHERGEESDPETANQNLRRHLDLSLKQVAFFIVPSTAAFIFLGDIIAAALFQTETGKFGPVQARLVWFMLAGSAVGLLASTLGRLYSSTFYALQDTRTPLRFALVRVALTTALGWIGALYVPGWLGIDESWGAMFLTATSGIAGWVEFSLLRRALNAKIGRTGIEASFLVRLWLPALAAAAGGWAVKLLAEHFQPALHLHPIILAAIVFADFGVIYLLGTLWSGVPHARDLVGSVTRRFRR